MCDENFYIERTGTEVVYDNDNRIISKDTSKLLSNFREHDAYVLLGEPGAGKTDSFKYEGKPSDCYYITARKFLNFDIQPGWYSKTLFIDGLDEVRVGSTNGLIPLDAIRNKLLAMGKPKFRISCREADWRSASDRKDFEEVSIDGKLTVIHLDELNEKGIKNFVKYKNKELNISDFIEWGYKHTLMPMLGNPQILKLIVSIISDGIYLDTKGEIYRAACKKMVFEMNDAHAEDQKSKKYTTEQLLQAAGKMFAHQLIAELDGYSLTQKKDSEYTPYYKNIFESDAELFEQSLKTNLFKQGQVDDIREPVHRSVAEYLAADYLSNLIENNGLPVRRFLALITTHDGGIVSSLRGLFAWFISLCPGQRYLLLERDPLGVVLYGDVSQFSTEQKKELFLLLYHEAEKHPGFRSENWLSSPFGALATKDMESVLRKLVETASREVADQAIVNCVVDAIEHGEVKSKLSDLLLAIVTDKTWMIEIRRTALRSLCFIEDSDKHLLVNLVDDIGAEKIEDSEDQLLGTLLTHLYPETIKAEKIFDYFHRPKKEHFLGKYNDFWSHKLLQKSNDTDISTLLDQLGKRKEIKEFLMHDYSFSSFISELLVNGITRFGEKISVKRLYGWLGVGLNKYESSILEPVRRNKKIATIQQWLSERPELYKDVIAEGTSRIIDNNEPWKHFYKITARLYGAIAPDDIGFWYLEQAQRAVHKKIADDYFRQAVWQINTPENDKKYTLDTIFSWVEKNPEYKLALQKMLVEDGKDYQERIDSAQEKIKRNLGQIKRKTDYINHVLKYKNEIKAGTAPPAIFHDIAHAYRKLFMDVKGETPHERVLSLLNNSEELTACAFEGLKKILFRDDLPSVKDIIKVSTTGKFFNISYAVLVGLEEINFENISEWRNVTDTQYEKAIAFYLTGYSDSVPSWFKTLLKFRAELVSEVFLQYVHASVRSGKENITGLYQSAYDEDWTEVAKKTVIALLNDYPLRTKNSQIYNVQYLLIAALRYADKKDLIELVNKKTSQVSMNMMQHSRWLATGLMLSPDKYEKPVNEFMKAGIIRVRAIASFLITKQGYDQWVPKYTLPVTTLVMLIRKLGSSFRPYTIKNESYRVTFEMDAAKMVSDFIHQLSDLNDEDISQQFESLINDPGLSEWCSRLKGKLYEYKKRRRDAEFIQPDLNSVVNTLANKEPANAADLMALVLDHLEALAVRIRKSDTNDYQQYWGSKSSKDGSRIPKIENECRDALLSDLRMQLNPLSINAEKEGYFADDNRSDIKITYLNNNRRIVLPVEIKKNSYREKKKDSHKNVWNAWKVQLMAQYAQDPDALGFGVYLVFWFGTGDVPLSPSGKKPTTAEEMKNTLQSMMTDEEKRLIGLCVIDCSLNSLKGVSIN
ncbi:hypothetical protein MNBD_GAMMA06-1706 [hydrothermal vent metagenome]|uniref:Uncharacterized protein n=1 Tax=hydrothermal vent metagenome TaxID=652676 RepID=A0A3B0W2T8_9ZZZZ